MARSTLGFRSLLAVITAFGLVPNAIGSVAPPREPAAARVASPVAMLATALSHCGEELSARQRWHIASAIHQESQRYGYDPLFILAMVEVESTCSPTARSRDGAIGLIQVKPSVARAVTAESGLRWRGARTLTQPALNLHLGVRYLAQLERRFGDPHLAVAAFNLGPKRVRRMSREHARRVPYVRKVLAAYEDLLAQHAAKRS
jgi:soluble lytic murein transglycosylase